MPFEDFLQVTDEISRKYNPNTIMIVLTGGEPLLRSDLEEFGQKISAQGFPWGLVTNGLAFTERRFRSLRQAGLGAVTVSFDGFEAEHNFLRRHPRSFEKAEAAIKLLVNEPDMVYDVVTCVFPKNLEHLPDFEKYLVGLGVKHWRIFSIFPTGRAKTNPDLSLDASQLSELMLFISKSRAAGRINVSYSCEGFLGAFENEVREGFSFCRAGIHIGSVLVDGSVSACPNINHSFVQGSIYEEKFTDIWESKFQSMRNRNFAKKGICAECSVFDFCRGNGIHLHENETDGVQVCHYNMLKNS